LAALA
jgi:hypothetical protein